MAYTWTNKTKTGGVGLTGKIVQKGKDDFPLMYANDLDWANVEVESGINLNTTDDLLDYIKGGNSSIIGRIDELELSNAGYEIRCDKSVCYVGDIVGQGYQNQRLPVSIYKNGTLLSWTDAYTDGITFDSNNFTKPSGGNDLIHWSTSDCYLQGEANKIGTYVFNFKKDNVNIASFMLTVLMKPLESYHTTIYISSQTKPITPTGGSYNFSTKAFTAPSGWSTSINGLTSPIWFSNGSVFSDSGSNPVWSEPCMYFDHDMISVEHQSRNVAVYLTTSSDVTQANTPSGGTYDWSNDTWTVPKTSANANTYWSKTPAASINAYLEGINTNAEGYQGGKYITWVSYKYYRSDLSDGTRSNFSEGAWSTPVKYIDIDAILDDAKTRSQKIVSDAIEEAYSNLEEAASLINEGGVVVDAVRSLYEWKILDSATTSVITSSDTDLYAPFANRFLNNGQLIGSIDQLNTPVSGSTNSILKSDYFNKCILFDSITDEELVQHLNVYVGYVNTTKELRTQMAVLDTQVGTLTTSVNRMTPDNIRLQVSEALQKEYAYVPITQSEFEAQETNNPEKCHKFLYDNSGNLTSTVITELATTTYNAQTNNYNGYQIGHYYRRKNTQNIYEYYRCDYPLSTGFMSLLANRATLGVASNTADNGQEKGAFISFGFDQYGDGETLIGGDTVKITGQTIAGAIAAQDLIIKNKSYLKGNGDAIFGAGTNGESRFLADGTGYIANGTIRWRNGDTYIEDLYIGDPAMGWHINGGAMGPNNEYVDLMPFIWSQYHDTTNSKYVNLAIRPDCIESYSKTTNDSGYGTGTRTVNWSIAQDGSATFAKGNIAFNNDGSATLGNASGAHIEMSSAGSVSLHGIDVNISSANSTTIASGIIGSAEATSILLDGQSGNVGITGKLNTQDLSVGNGACFFKGTNTALSPTTLHGHDYGANTAGAGHLANGNIWWDNEGNLSIGGKVNLKGTSLEWGGSVQTYELFAQMFQGTYLGTDFSNSGALYHLPDPAEYEGREIFVEVNVRGDELATIFSTYQPSQNGTSNNGSYAYQCWSLPCFDIKSTNPNHKWIKWGADACKYNSCEMDRMPKYYHIGEPDTYNSENPTHSVNTYNSDAADAHDIAYRLHDFCDLTEVGTGLADITASHGIYQHNRAGLYLVPTDAKYAQMYAYATASGNAHAYDYVTLRMRCQAKKIKSSNKYCWEIQTTDFMPCFDALEYSCTPPANHTGMSIYDATKSWFQNNYEDVIAGTVLAFDEDLIS